MTDKKSIIEKIKKLLSMANTKHYNEHEAAVAASQAQRLLDKHNLSSADIAVEEINEKPLETNQRTPYPWMQRLAGSVARNFNCTMFLRQDHKKLDLIFVGTDLDIEIAQYVFQYLYKTIITMHRKFGKSVSKEHHNRQGAIDSYILGITMSLNDELRNFAEANKKKSETAVNPTTKMTGLELMIVKQNKIENYLSKYKMKQSKARGGGITDPNAYASGQCAGSKINLRRGVAGSNSRGHQLA
jgi:hypothetical protein